MANDRINFYYDPAREGYDTTLWKTVSGVPSVVSGNIRLNAAKIIGYADIFKGELTYNINIPSAPYAFLTGGTAATAVVATWEAVTDAEFAISIDGTAIEVTALDFTGVTTMAEVATAIQTAIRAVTGDTTTTVAWSTDHFVITAVSAITVTSAVAAPAGTDISGVGATAFMDAETAVGTVTAAADREFGFQQMNCLEKLTFKINAGALTAEALFETETESLAIPWETAWTGVDTNFTIKWTGFSAEFLINGIRRAFFNDVSVPKRAMSQMFSNASADNMDIVFVEGNNIQGYI